MKYDLKTREKMEAKPKRIFMTPGKTNQEDRNNFIDFWVRYMKSHSDEEWSRQQNLLINSQIQTARSFYNRLSETPEGKDILKSLKKKN